MTGRELAEYILSLENPDLPIVTCEWALDGMMDYYDISSDLVYIKEVVNYVWNEVIKDYVCISELKIVIGEAF